MTARKTLVFALCTVTAGSLGLSACQGGGSSLAPPPTGVSNNSSAKPGGAAGDGSTTGKKALKGKVVVVDPGHNAGVLGGEVFVGNGTKSCDTSGTATNAGYEEHAFTWDVSVRLRKILKARGAKVVMTRPNDSGKGPCVDKRAAIGNKAKADAAISIHADGAAASGHGFHVIEPKAVPGYNEKIVAPSRRLGTVVRDAFHKGTGLPFSTYTGGGRGVTVRDDLGGLNLSKIPKIFIETGNMRNAGDAAKLSSAKFRQLMAVSLADGLTKYLTTGAN